LPAEVDEYYAIKEKVEATGWQPGQGGIQSAGGPQQNAAKILAQALMKRAIADIPIVTHIQKESAGMNKLYSQSMCSVNQWRAYQAAEAMVSAEVEDVRAEADQLEPGWAGVIWRQAMQYHNVLKQKHEAEAKAVEDQAKKRKEVEMAVAAAKANDPDYKAKMAEKAAQELIKAEEREKESKKAFNNKSGGMKKGFLDGKGKKGKK
jgi:Preprotein translocase subunit Sec66